jgi:hypothetical protein
VNFRTVHSIAFRMLGLRRGDVVTEEHLAELAEITGELFAGDVGDDAPASGRNADPLLTIDHYARTTGVSLRTAWEDHGGQVDWFRLKRFSESYALYKSDRGLVDFTDMLVMCVAGHAPPLPVEVAIVDEAQDLTLLQHRVVARAFANAKELILAGDDCQCIHRWAGAAEDLFLDLAKDHEIEVLPLSHRLPRSVFDLSVQIQERISKRYEKETSCSDRRGSVEWLASPEEADLSRGEWLALARTKRQLKELEAEARRQGVVYSVKGRSSVCQDDIHVIQAYERLRAGGSVPIEDARAVASMCGRKIHAGADHMTAASMGIDAAVIWHDALVGMPLPTREYYLACLRRGEDLRKPPRVRIETIHGAKGAEAQNVLLITDLTRKTMAGYELDPDSEHRVFYVGVTRASENLRLVAPRGPAGYPL